MSSDLTRRSMLRAGGAIGVVGLASALAACTGAGRRSTPTPSDQLTGDDVEAQPGDRVLVVYFSRAGENYYFGDRIDLDVGNTEVAVGLITDAIGADVFRIRPQDPHSDDYEETVARNVREEQSDARPAIRNTFPDVSAYDVILLGSPVWNSQSPMIMRTFLDAVDLTGKKVFPFVTYAVSRLGSVPDDYARLAPTADHGSGLALEGETVRSAKSDVASWLKQIGLRR